MHRKTPVVPWASFLVALAVPLSAAAAQTPAQTPAASSGFTVNLPLTFFGEVRARPEWFSGATGQPGDQYTYLRSRIGVRFDPTPGARIVVQAQDSRVLGAETNTNATAVAADVFDLHQAYLELYNQSGKLSAAVRAGRQEISFGNERLIGVSNWTNTGRTFDAVRVLLSPRATESAPAPAWTATLVGSAVEERGAHFDVPGTATADHLFAAAYATHTLFGDGLIDGTVLYDRNGHYRAYNDASRTTFDSHLTTRLGPAPLRAELEGAWQTGRQHVLATGVSQDLEAWLAAARLATLPFGSRRAFVGVGADILSGDGSPLDGRYSAFATMYPSNHGFYGLMDLIGDPATSTKERGLADVLANGAIGLTSRSSLRAEVHHFSMMAGTDRPLGWETDLTLPTRVNRAATVDLGYSAFRADDGAGVVGLANPGRTRSWVYLQLTVGF
ncbi:MAG TPA: alginate export family protein [Gemmatimonadaceae bacterium]|jgi:hypothetical protein